MNNSVYQVLITTPAFEEGRSAARTDMLRVQGPVTPNEAFMKALRSEFVAGYRFELAEFNQLAEETRAKMLSLWERQRSVKWVACSEAEFQAAGEKSHVLRPYQSDTALCGISASHANIWRGNSAKPKCKECTERVAEGRF